MKAQIEDRKATVGHLQAVWDALAKNDPLLAIVSSPEKKGRGWKLDEFLKTGKDEVKQLMTTLAVNDIHFVSEAALDFGCGVGRVSQALARRFDVVYGVDISPQMIKMALQLNQLAKSAAILSMQKKTCASFGTGCRAGGSHLVRKQGLANSAASGVRRRNDSGRSDDANLGSESGNHVGGKEYTRG
jgi:SAM-dependent methyltransferase